MGYGYRSNIGDLDTMKKAIFAVLFHVCSSEKNNYHVYCPPGADSWCTNLVRACRKIAIKHLNPTFSDLSDDNLLPKCPHVKTQNQNESFNGLIWRRTPKDRFVYDAVIHFNIGNLATLLIFDKVNIERGCYTTLGCITDKNCRIQKAKRQSSDSAKPDGATCVSKKNDMFFAKITTK